MKPKIANTSQVLTPLNHSGLSFQYSVLKQKMDNALFLFQIRNHIRKYCYEFLLLYLPYYLLVTITLSASVAPNQLDNN